MDKENREVQRKMVRGLLDLIMLQIIHDHVSHGYAIIQKIRNSFGVYFSASTVYPLLGLLEQKGYIEGKWDMATEKPRRLYSLTVQGEQLLNNGENILTIVCKNLDVQVKMTHDAK